MVIGHILELNLHIKSRLMFYQKCQIKWNYWKQWNDYNDQPGTVPGPDQSTQPDSATAAIQPKLAGVSLFKII